ncbi:MAG: shikimate dehydrogenase, partial [candidate division WOR-3 bacterium]
MLITGVIGYPLRLTYSPTMHNAAFKELNVEGIYYPLSVPPEGFKEIILRIRQLKFRGVNITNPYKVEVIKYLDEMSSIARIVGAVNTVLIKHNKMIGENTDVYGFNESLRIHNIDLENRVVLIIGAGGVARAILYVLGKKRTQKIFVTNRTISKPCALTKKYDIAVVEIEQVRQIIGDIDFVVNATSTDMHKRIVPFLKNGSMYYDTNYRFKIPERKGIRVINGIDMLLFQGA